MGLGNRPYWKDDQGARFGGGSAGGGMGFAFPKPGPTVKVLLLLNAVGFLFQILVLAVFKVPVSMYLGATPAGWWQIWRYISFQFLHSPEDIWHIVLNMLALYMLGTPLERKWGSGVFLKYYLACGVCAGLSYVVMGHLLDLPPTFPLVGASGGVYGIILACAVVLPHIQIIFLFFPVPIRLAAIIIFGIMVLTLLTGLASGQGRLSSGFWSQVAHFGGAAAGAVWIWVLPGFLQAREQAKEKAQAGAWEKRMKQRADEQAEMDRILQKIHDYGLGSLSTREKKFLRDTTERQRKEEKRMNRL
ncbi:MAG: rhomboid family intramembrane serine protease [Phycisphaerae bacterium]